MDAELKAAFADLNKRLDGIDDRLERIEMDVKGCKDKLDVLTTRFNTLRFVVQTEGHDAAEEHARNNPLNP